jgi:hypothetical protein
MTVAAQVQHLGATLKSSHKIRKNIGEEFENKSHNSEADALYSECDSNDLNASFEKGKGDTEGARSSD